MHILNSADTDHPGVVIVFLVGIHNHGCREEPRESGGGGEITLEMFGDSLY